MPFIPNDRDKSIEAKRRFCDLTGAISEDQTLAGDLMLGNHSVAVRVADGGTINQIRAVRYQTLVVLRNDRWYVVAPDDVIELVTRTATGQHGQNPLENKRLTPSAVTQFEVVDEAQLREYVLDAIAKGEARPDLRLALNDISERLRELSAESAEIVAEARRLVGGGNS